MILLSVSALPFLLTFSELERLATVRFLRLDFSPRFPPSKRAEETLARGSRRISTRSLPFLPFPLVLFYMHPFLQSTSSKHPGSLDAGLSGIGVPLDYFGEETEEVGHFPSFLFCCRFLSAASSNFLPAFLCSLGIRPLV